MGDFKQRGGGFRGNGGGKPRFGGGNFQKKSWGGDRGGDRGEVTMHQATCSGCGKSCEVPFRPTNGKPVFCKDCFSSNREGGERDRAPRRDFDRNERPARGFDHRHDGPRHDKPVTAGNEGLVRQIEALTVKMDRLIQSVENLNRTKPMLPKEEVKKEEPKQPNKEVKIAKIEASLKGDKLIKATVKKSTKKKPIKR